MGGRLRMSYVEQVRMNSRDKRHGPDSQAFVIVKCVLLRVCPLQPNVALCFV